jgi:hypothetical protein
MLTSCEKEHSSEMSPLDTRLRTFTILDDTKNTWGVYLYIPIPINTYTYNYLYIYRPILIYTYTYIYLYLYLYIPIPTIFNKTQTQLFWSVL